MEGVKKTRGCQFFSLKVGLVLEWGYRERVKRKFIRLHLDKCFVLPFLGVGDDVLFYA